MDDLNGSLKGSKPKAAINGAVKQALNGHAGGPRLRRKPSRPGFLSRIFNILARLLTWYSIITILLRCPATLDACDDTSPRICKPYFHLKQTVSPYLHPYYDAYAAPYVELVKPYYNTVDERVITPGWGYAKKYGAPRVEQAQVFTRAQWEKNVQPQIAKYQNLARSQYDQNLSPHVNSVRTAFGPYYDIARTNALQTYHELLLPSYQYIQPYARRGYLAASAFTTDTAIPSALWAWNKTYLFLDATVWPQLKVIYVENVEPQLVKIGKRLGRYSSGKKSIPKPVMEVSASATTAKRTSSFNKPTPSMVSSSPTPSSSSKSSVTSSPTNIPDSSSRSESESTTVHSIGSGGPSLVPISPPDIDESAEVEDPVRRTARETVAADLRDWQERYAKAAEEGAAEISNQVQEISKKMIRRNARVVGKSLLEDLQTSIVSELVGLRRDITRIVGSVKQTNKSEEAVNAVSGSGITAEEAQEAVVQVVRKAGMNIKAKAQAVRAWREAYETEIQASITKAAESHFLILENIRDLALQKIGMKWAWMDGVTYKDWAKYHMLKAKFDEWKGELQSLIVTHPSLEAAQLEAAGIEEEAMQLAGNAAKELARLKKVGGWKLIAADDTSEFDSELMRQAAEVAEAARNAPPETTEINTDVPEAIKSSTNDVEPGTDDSAPATAETADGSGKGSDGSEIAANHSNETTGVSREATNVFAEEPVEVYEATTGSVFPEEASETAGDAVPVAESLTPVADDELVPPAVSEAEVSGASDSTSDAAKEPTLADGPVIDAEDKATSATVKVVEHVQSVVRDVLDAARGVSEAEGKAGEADYVKDEL